MNVSDIIREMQYQRLQQTEHVQRQPDEPFMEERHLNNMVIEKRLQQMWIDLRETDNELAKTCPELQSLKRKQKKKKK